MERPVAVGAFIAIAGFAALLVSAFALIRGHLGWATIKNRATALAALGASVAVMIVGGVLTPAPATTPAVPSTQVAATTTPPSPTATPTPTPTLTPSVVPASTQPPAPQAPATATSQPTIVRFAPVPAPATSTRAVSSTRVASGTTVVAAKAAPATKAAAANPAPTKVAVAAASYKNCAAVRAAGMAPLHKGQPGYAKHLDRDGDGIACEK